MLLALVSVPAVAEDDETLDKFDNWMQALREKAKEADHIIGPEDIDTVRKYSMNDSGAMATGWGEIDGQWEMFDNGGVWLYTWDGN